MNILPRHNFKSQLQEIKTQKLLPYQKREGATVTLELTELNSLYLYHVSALPQLTSHMFIGSTIVQVKVSYNVHYNMSILAASPCGKNNITTFIEVFYGELFKSATKQ